MGGNNLNIGVEGIIRYGTFLCCLGNPRTVWRPFVSKDTVTLLFNVNVCFLLPQRSSYKDLAMELDQMLREMNHNRTPNLSPRLMLECLAGGVLGSKRVDNSFLVD